MRIIGALVLQYQNNNVTTLDSYFDLSFVGFFARSSTKELLMFFTTEIVKKHYLNKINDGKMHVILHEQTNNNLCILYRGNQSVCIICDQEYPKRVIYDLINSIINKSNTLSNIVNDCNDPSKIDKIVGIQKTLDETKDILYDTIEKVLERGEKLDVMVAKSTELSETTKRFYDSSRKMNSCCNVV